MYTQMYEHVDVQMYIRTCTPIFAAAAVQPQPTLLTLNPKPETLSP